MLLGSVVGTGLPWRVRPKVTPSKDNRKLNHMVAASSTRVTCASKCRHSKEEAKKMMKRWREDLMTNKTRCLIAKTSITLMTVIIFLTNINRNRKFHQMRKEGAKMLLKASNRVWVMWRIQARNNPSNQRIKGYKISGHPKKITQEISQSSIKMYNPRIEIPK